MAVKREEWDDARGTTLQTPRSMKKKWGGGAPDAGVFACSS